KLAPGDYVGTIVRDKSVVKGSASDVVHRAFVAVKEGRDNAKAAVRDGVEGKAVHQCSCDALEQHGFETNTSAEVPYGFIHGTGHGVGLQIHEAPRVSSADNILRSGMVVTIEPGLYYPEWGGMRLEDMLAVTDDGSDCLTTVDTYLEIP
ncbi:MAG TPA: M24 family metallopeptidase, partial [Myxococcales bacterium]|nr:M24 family metallopeptidase [Myxococcales bacterium]